MAESLPASAVPHEHQFDMAALPRSDAYPTLIVLLCHTCGVAFRLEPETLAWVAIPYPATTATHVPGR